MRPPVPLIDKEKVCEIALDLIAREGIETLTIRRLASEIGVNGASLYHHFHNKDEIVLGAAELALSRTRVKRYEGEPWDEWCLRNAQGLYRLLRKHPDLIPVLVRRNDLHLGFAETDAYFAEFERQGVAIGLVWTLMESLQAFAIGMVMQEQVGMDRKTPMTDEFPSLKRATQSRLLNNADAFTLGCRALIAAVGDESRRIAASGKKAAKPARRATATRAARSPRASASRRA